MQPSSKKMALAYALVERIDDARASRLVDVDISHKVGATGGTLLVTVARSLRTLWTASALPLGTLAPLCL